MTSPEPEGARPLAKAHISIDVIVRLRRLALVAFGGSVVLLALLAFVLRWFSSGAVFAVAAGGFVAAGCALVVLHLLQRWSRAGLGALSIEGDEMVVRRLGTRGLPVERRFPIRSIVTGYRTDGEVRLRTKRGEIVTVLFQRPEEGEAILQAVGHDAHQRVLEVPIATIASRFPAVTPLVWLMAIFSTPSTLYSPVILAVVLVELLKGRAHGMGAMVPILAWVLFQAATMALCVRLLQRRAVTIGTDGISFRRFLRKRFYPYSAVAAAEPAPAGVFIVLRSGRRVRLRTRAGWRRGGLDEPTEALLERIAAARRAAASATDMHAKIQLLERRGRSVTEWRRHLSTLVGQAGYRMGAVTPAELSAVIADASLPAEHRVAAALALTAAEPVEARTRVRIAASASADQDLRAALEHAAEGEIDEARLDRLRVR